MLQWAINDGSKFKFGTEGELLVDREKQLHIVIKFESKVGVFKVIVLVTELDFCSLVGTHNCNSYTNNITSFSTSPLFPPRSAFTSAFPPGGLFSRSPVSCSSTLGSTSLGGPIQLIRPPFMTTTKSALWRNLCWGDILHNLVSFQFLLAVQEIKEGS